MSDHARLLELYDQRDQRANELYDETRRLRIEMDRAASWLEARQYPPRYAAEILRAALAERNA